MQKLNIYTALLVSLFTLNATAMEEMIAHTQWQLAEEKRGELKVFFIQIPKAENDLRIHSANHDDSLYHEKVYRDEKVYRAFKDLIAVKHAKNDSYMVARTMERTEGGAVVELYFDAHELNKALFGQYPSFSVQNLNELWKYKNPVSNLPLRWLEYYECEPQEKVFKFVCEFESQFCAVLCSQAELRSKNNKPNFWHYKFYANQDDDLQLAASAKNNLGVMYKNGHGIVCADFARAVKLFQEVTKQTYNLRAAAIAKCNLGVMYYHGHGVEKDYARAKQLYEQVAAQEDDLGSAARAQNNLGDMYRHGHGVAVNYVTAKKLYQDAANQTHDFRVLAAAKDAIATLEEVMKKNAE